MTDFTFEEWAASMQVKFYFLTGFSAPWHDENFYSATKYAWANGDNAIDTAEFIAFDWFTEPEAGYIERCFNTCGSPILSWFDGISNGAISILKYNGFKVVRNGDKLCFDIYKSK